MNKTGYYVLCFALIVFLYCAGIFAWAIDQEGYRIAIAGAGVSSALWLILTVTQRFSETD